MSYRCELGGRMRGQACEVHDRLRVVTRARVWVTPVVVVWGSFPAQLIEGTCVFVHGDALVDWLRSKQQQIVPSRITQIAAALQAVVAGVQLLHP